MNKFIADLLIDNEENVKEISTYIFEKSKGNPFFAIELVKHLIIDKVIYYKQKHWKKDNMHCDVSN